MTGMRAALLIAISEYQNLHKLSSPINDVKNLANLLRDENIGGYSLEPLMINEDNVVATKRIKEFLDKERDPDDFLLLYYSGHGIVDNNNRLYLATKNTDTDNLDATALSSEDIMIYLKDSYAQQKLLILDCCFSGAFSTSTDLNVKGYFPINFEGDRGLFILTASNEIGPAKQIETDDSKKVSLFTSLMVQGLTYGEADADDDKKITAEELYHYIYKRIKEKEKVENRLYQEPMWSAIGAKGEIVVAKRPVICSTSNWNDPILAARIDAMKNAIKGIAGESDDGKTVEWNKYFDLKNVKVHEDVWTGVHAQ